MNMTYLNWVENSLGSCRKIGENDRVFFSNFLTLRNGNVNDPSLRGEA